MKKKVIIPEHHIILKAEEISLGDNLPTWKIDNLKLFSNPVICSGPHPYYFTDGEFHTVFASTISTYPQYAYSNKREGDPVCDSFRIQIYPNFIVVCITDGCNWGERPREASNKAKDNFTLYIQNNITNAKNLKSIGPILIAALDAAHYSIVEDKKDIWMAGTTTLLGGLCVPMKGSAPTKWGFVGITIGDCKAYLWKEKEKEVIDLTEGNRMNITDPRDPGGRIGPHANGGGADLRNLSIFYTPCEEEDLILILSDGVHDNFDPQTLGKVPRAIGLDQDDWDSVDIAIGTKAKTKYMCNLIKSLIVDPTMGNTMTPKLITKQIITYCLNLTAPSREFMEQNPFAALASDYEKYPGKMDHTTCIVFRVGLFDKEKEKLYSISQKETTCPDIWPF